MLLPALNPVGFPSGGVIPTGEALLCWPMRWGRAEGARAWLLQDHAEAGVDVWEPWSVGPEF